MDAEQIANIFSNDLPTVVQFSDAQWLYLQDNNNNQYSNYIQFVTTTLKQQFIDYHNGWFQVPIRVEIVNTAANPLQQAFPPLIALRESVLSLLGQLIVSTDQGQTLVNDVNTQYINNIRLKIENNLDWIHCNGSDLDFAYDHYPLVPSATTRGNVGVDPVAYGQSAAFVAPQGLSPYAKYNSPITNDANEYGSIQPGIFTLTTSGTIFTGINGVAFTASASPYATVSFNDSQVGYFPYTTDSSSHLASIGGITLSNYSTFANGSYTVLAIGSAGNPQALAAAGTSASSASQPWLNEVMTLPITITVTSGTPVFTSIGGVLAVQTAATYNAAVTGQVAQKNVHFNAGFLERATIFQNASSYQYVAAGGTMPSLVQATYGGHYWQYVAVIPLKLVHDFFFQLNFPVVNVGFNIQLYLQQTNGANGTISYPPFQIGNNTLSVVNGLNTTASPSIYYGQGINQSGCRLYYRSCKFTPADNARMAAMLTTGFTKSLKFETVDWILPANYIVQPGSGPAQFNLEQSCVHPVRIWVLSYPNNVALSTGAGVGSFLQSNTYATGIVPGYWNNTNILVNNNPYWRQNFQTYQDQWEQLREQFNPETGSMLRYVDWRNFQRYLCFDLTRIADRLQSPTEPVSLIFTGNRADNLPYALEMVFLVERTNQVTMRFSSSDVAVVVGNLD